MSQYPTILAGQTVTAQLLTSMLPQFVHKTAHTDRASTTTLTDDPDLTIELEASAIYHVEMFIHYAAISAAGFQTAWTTPSGATGGRWAMGAGPTQVSSIDVLGRFGLHTFTTSTEYGDRNSATNQMGALEQGIVITSSAGTLALKWAQETSNATATRVASESFMRITRLG